MFNTLTLTNTELTNKHALTFQDFSNVLITPLQISNMLNSELSVNGLIAGALCSHYGRLARANMRSATLSSDAALRLAENTIPTLENSRSTAADIYAHGITETWVLEKALIGLVACSEDRHTAKKIKTWTEDALRDIGLNPSQLLAPV